MSSKNGPIDVFLIQDINQQDAHLPSEDNGSSILEESDPLLKHIEFPTSEYDFELKDHEGPADLYELGDVLNMNIFNFNHPFG